MDRKQELIAKQSSKPGMRGKVNAKCIECIYDDIGGGGSWRNQAENCTCLTCPLYSVRPVSSKGSDDPEDE